MLVKCICTNCAGHLEFEEDSAGQKIKCPHCGFDTVLFLPGAEKAEAEVASLTRKLAIQRRLLLLVGVLVVVGAVVWAVYHWVYPLFEDLLPSTDSSVFPILFSAGLCLVLPLVLAWLALPVVWFIQTRKLLGLLERIEAALSTQAPPAVPEAFSRSDRGIAEDARKM